MADVRPDLPIEGYYRIRMVRGGPWVPVKIWFAPPADPDNPDELLDRSPRWQATRNGEACDVWTVWPFCADKTITKDEYDYMLAHGEWARAHSPNHPSADPRRPVDLSKAPPPVFGKPKP